MNKLELSELREKFLVEYCKEMCWNPNELTNRQMLIIVSQNRWKNPKQV